MPMNRMSRAAFSLKYFALYLNLVGLGMVLMPNQLLPAFGMPATTEVWVRVAGVLTFNIGLYYGFAARSEATGVFRASVHARLLVLLSFGGFAWLDLAPPMLALFGAVDGAGGIWTWLALRADRRAPSKYLERPA